MENTLESQPVDKALTHTLYMLLFWPGIMAALKLFIEHGEDRTPTWIHGYMFGPLSPQTYNEIVIAYLYIVPYYAISMSTAIFCCRAFSHPDNNKNDFMRRLHQSHRYAFLMFIGLILLTAFIKAFTPENISCLIIFPAFNMTLYSTLAFLSLPILILVFAFFYLNDVRMKILLLGLNLIYYSMLGYAATAVKSC